MKEAKLKVKLIAHTPNPEKVIATSAKLCYSKVGVEELEQGLTKENVDKFIKMIMSLGHESPVEHVNFTFAIEGISRTLSHQLVRHRLASYSQQSQRYVNLEGGFEYIKPNVVKEFGFFIGNIYDKAMKSAYDNYIRLTYEILECLKDEFTDTQEEYYDYNMLLEDFKTIFPKKYKEFEKKAIENARYVLPNACETKIIVTMNIRTLLNFFKHRDCNRAQDEIRELSEDMLKICKEISPLLFSKAGSTCRYDKCNEGKMCCGNPKTGVE